MSNATCEHSSDALLNESCKESRATFSFKYVTWCIKERDVTFRSDAVRNASCTGERVISRNQSRHTQQSVIPPVPTTHHVMRHIRSDVTCLWHGTEWDVSGMRRVRRHDTFLSHVKEWVISGVTCHTRGKKKKQVAPHSTMSHGTSCCTDLLLIAHTPRCGGSISLFSGYCATSQGCSTCVR